MTRFHLGLCAGALACALIAWNLEPRLAAGSALGWAVGTLAAVIGVRMQLRSLQARGPNSNRAMESMVVTFLAKLALLLCGALLLRYAEPAARWFDWMAYLIAFPCAVLLATTLGSLDLLQALRQASQAKSA
jgi:hypothetical protein